jgi:hypothetical protein
MELEEQQKRIISEQRDQLMALRAQLKSLKQGVSEDLVASLFTQYKSKTVGKTIGLQVPGDLRSRLLGQGNMRNASSYKQVILTCIELGVRQLEENSNVASSMETVQGILGPTGPGIGTNPSADGSAGVSRGTSVLADN